MYTSSPVAKRKPLQIVLIALVCLLSFPNNGFAQQGTRDIPLVQLGDVRTDNNMRMKVTRDQVFADPSLKCRAGNCEVTSFSIAFAPAGETIVGPYKTIGSTIKAEQLKILRESKNREIKIFIEDIHVKDKGKDVVTKPLVLICVP